MKILEYISTRLVSRFLRRVRKYAKEHVTVEFDNTIDIFKIYLRNDDYLDLEHILVSGLDAQVYQYWHSLSSSKGHFHFQGKELTYICVNAENCIGSDYVIYVTHVDGEQVRTHNTLTLLPEDYVKALAECIRREYALIWVRSEKESKNPKKHTKLYTDI